MTETTQPKEVLGIFITKNEISNLNIEYIHVTDFAIQTILKSIHLTYEAQTETMDRLVERTPAFFALPEDERMNKIKTALTYETVLEYLRLHEYIREGINMVEMAVDEEGSLVVTAYYVDQTELTEKIFQDEMTEEQELQLEKEMNILDGSINIYEEAKKKLETMQANNVLPFQNRAQRRLAKSQQKVRKSHK